MILSMPVTPSFSRLALAMSGPAFWDGAAEHRHDLAFGAIFRRHAPLDGAMIYRRRSSAALAA
jgi:hypothetical protein